MWGQRFGWAFRALAVLSVVVNLFGAVTFDRVHRFYDDDGTQRRLFQPEGRPRTIADHEAGERQAV